MPRLPLVPLVAILAALVQPVVAAPADYSEQQLKADLKLFEDAKLSHGDEDLLNFFRGRLLADADRDRIAGLVAKLSSKTFKEREQTRTELEKIGPPALPLLR
jgi:hypothetical protein